MAAIIAPASLATPPMPFLLRDMSESIGQMVVVPDDRWDDVIKILQRHKIQFIETDQGSFAYLPNGDANGGLFELR